MSEAIKQNRQQALLELIRSKQARTQSDLVSGLKKKGFSAGQATISRDLQELGIFRRGGKYELSAPAAAEESWITLLRHPNFKIAPAGDALVIVRIGLGQAPFLAAQMDLQEWPEVIGTIAGDDTLFVAVGSKQDQKKFIKRIESALK